MLESLEYPTSTASYRLKTKYEYLHGILNKVSDFNAPATVFWQLTAASERGQPMDEQLGNGARIITGFDSLTGLVSYRQTGTGGQGTNRQNLAFEWDKNGNLKKRIDGNQANLAEEFFYDALDRLDYSTLNGVTNLDLTLDAIGNITAKTSATNPAENVGSYTYHATKKHAVASTSNGWSFGYDANGNMTSYKGNTVSWYSYNLPATINSAGQSSQFWYGPNRNRWKQVATYPSSTETTIYVGGILEKMTVATGTAWRHYIQAGSAQVVYTRWSTGANETRYVTTDHLNSSTVVMDNKGAALVNLSFGAFGARRGSNWTGTPTGPEFTQIGNGTRHGYTGHEHLDNIGIIHMNGRVYDPVLGRFLSADPFMPGSLGSQGMNRYAYVGNKPLSLTDPSGFAPRKGFTLYAPINGRSVEAMATEAIQQIADAYGVSDARVAGILLASPDAQVQSLASRFGASRADIRAARGRAAGGGSAGVSGGRAAGSSTGASAGASSVSTPAGLVVLDELVVTASRRGGLERYSWVPGNGFASQWLTATAAGGAVGRVATTFGATTALPAPRSGLPAPMTPDSRNIGTGQDFGVWAGFTASEGWMLTLMNSDATASHDPGYILGSVVAVDVRMINQADLSSADLYPEIWVRSDGFVLTRTPVEETRAPAGWPFAN